MTYYYDFDGELKRDIERANADASAVGAPVRYVLPGGDYVGAAEALGVNFNALFVAALGADVNRDNCTRDNFPIARVTRIGIDNGVATVRRDVYAIRDMTHSIWDGIAHDINEYRNNNMISNSVRARAGDEAPRFRVETDADRAAFAEIEKRRAPVRYTNFGRKLREEWANNRRIIETAERLAAAMEVKGNEE